MAALPCQGHNTYHGWEKPAWESPEGTWQSQLPALPVTVNYNNVYRRKPTIIQCELGRQFHFHAEFPLPFLRQLAASFTIRMSSLEEAAPGFKATFPPAPCWNKGQDPFGSEWTSARSDGAASADTGKRWHCQWG